MYGAGLKEKLCRKECADCPFFQPEKLFMTILLEENKFTYYFGQYRSLVICMGIRYEQNRIR